MRLPESAGLLPVRVATSGWRRPARRDAGRRQPRVRTRRWLLPSSPVRQARGRRGHGRCRTAACTSRLPVRRRAAPDVLPAPRETAPAPQQTCRSSAGRRRSRCATPRRCIAGPCRTVVCAAVLLRLRGRPDTVRAPRRGCRASRVRTRDCCWRTRLRAASRRGLRRVRSGGSRRRGTL